MQQTRFLIAPEAKFKILLIGPRRLPPSLSTRTSRNGRAAVQ